MNILLTFLIILRMFSHQREIRKAFGPTYGQHYTDISSMFIESASLYCIVTTLLLGTFVSGHPTSEIWFSIAPSVQVSSLQYVSCLIPSSSFIFA